MLMHVTCRHCRRLSRTIFSIADLFFRDTVCPCPSPTSLPSIPPPRSLPPSVARVAPPMIGFKVGASLQSGSGLTGWRSFDAPSKRNRTRRWMERRGSGLARRSLRAASISLCVLQRKTTHMNMLRWPLLVLALYVVGYLVIIRPSARAYSGGRPTRWSASCLAESGRSKGSFVYRSELHWTNKLFAPLDSLVRAIFYKQEDLRVNKAYEQFYSNTSN